MSDLPTFPVDDTTLLALEHAMGGAYEIDQEGDLVLVGADYSTTDLLDFLAGVGDDPDGVIEVLHPGHEAPDRAPFFEQIAGAAVTFDPRPHYTRDCVIRALKSEVRRLRKNDKEVR